MLGNITTISGPVSLYIYKYNNKMYYFFGDVHFTNINTCEENGTRCDHYDNDLKNVIIDGPNCTDLGALFHNWFTFNNDYNIKTDFYAETPFTKDITRNPHYTVTSMDEQKPYTVFPYEDSWLALVTDIMSPCFLADKALCPYAPNVHAHYTDIRFYEQNNKWIDINMFDLTNVIGYILDNDINDIALGDYILIINTLLENAKTLINIFLKPNNYDKNMQVLWDMVTQLQDEHIKDLYIKKINDSSLQLVKRDGRYMHRIAWELQKLDTTIANLITHYIRSEIVKISKSIYKEWGSNLHNINDVLIRDYFIKFFGAQLVDLGALIMDSYTLARMFGQNESSQIIVYAGEYHILNYVDFFDGYLQAEQLLIIENQNESKCLYNENLYNFLNANKFRIHMYYKPKALQLLQEHDTIQIPEYKNWYNIVIKKYNNMYNVSFYGNGDKYVKIWSTKDVENFLIQCLYYDTNK